MSDTPPPLLSQPLAARLHFIPRLIRPLQHSLVHLLRRYFERSSGWVLLTTTGRKSGLPREVLLPCERTAEIIYVISTYGWQSDWIRNLRRNPQARATSAGWVLPVRAEIIEEDAAKQALVSAHPFFVPLPLAFLNLLHRTLLRPMWVPFLRWWVKGRPIVVLRRE